MPHYKTYFIDLDSTIYQGKTKYPSGKRFIQRLQDAKIPYLFVTNNSTKNPIDVANNLTINHDIPTSPNQVYTSAMATADYLSLHMPLNTKIYVIGEIGLVEALTAAIQTATQIDPLVIAKPESPIMTGALKRMAVKKADVIMVGDNYNTDILAGINNNIDTLLVYSGVSTPEQIKQVSTKPTHEVLSLDDWTI